MDQKAASNPYLISMGSQTRVAGPARQKREFKWTEPGQYVVKGEELREDIKNERFLQLEASLKSEEVCSYSIINLQLEQKKCCSSGEQN